MLGILHNTVTQNRMYREDLTTAEIEEFVSKLKKLPGCLDIGQDEAEKAALLFLRARKRDVNRAVELYKANKRMRYTENVDSIDPLDEGVRKELISGKFTMLPNTCGEHGDGDGGDLGATVAIFTANRHWPPLTTHRDTLKGVLYQLDVAMMDEQSQRKGLVVLYDMREAKYANFDYHLCIKLLNLFKGVYPVRLRKVIIVEPPIWFRAPFGVLRLFVKEKMRDRISTVDLDELHVHLPLSVIHKIFQQLTQPRHFDWLRTCLEKTGHASRLPEDYFVTPSPTHRTLTNSDLISDRFGHYGSLRLRQPNRLRHESEDRFGTVQGLVGHRYSTLASANAPPSSSMLLRDSRSRDRMLSSMYGTIHNSAGTYHTTVMSPKRTSNSGSVRISKTRQRNNSCLRSFSPASSTELSIPTNETTASSPTRLTVPEFIHRVHTLGALGLCAEFEAMFKDQPIRGSFDQFMLSENRRRNRYLDVPCLDSSAVELSDGTYLHANWVHGYRSPRAYLLAQGPLDNTRRDFWLAVWEHRVPVVVMLTKIVEGQRVKCAPYWPSRASVSSSHSSGSSPFLLYPLRGASSDLGGPNPTDPEDPKDQSQPSASYGEFHLVNISETMEHDGLYRRTRLELTRKGTSSPNDRISPKLPVAQNKSHPSADSSEVFHVDHFLFLGWPDFDVPSDTEGFLTFLKDVKTLHKARCDELCCVSNGDLNSQPLCPKNFPLLIHCSAGIGRTGTFVTVDICLQQALNEGYIDVPDVINRLREQRAGAVQVPKQYAFAHSALAFSLTKSRGAQH
ncbi:unnamed protein product [Dicrocoelium dendriticum]|nr:unnamed protein product [Dicrocoelium dendriticum]